MLLELPGEEMPDAGDRRERVRQPHSDDELADFALGPERPARHRGARCYRDAETSEPGDWLPDAVS